MHPSPCQCAECAPRLNPLPRVGLRALPARRLTPTIASLPDLTRVGRDGAPQNMPAYRITGLQPLRLGSMPADAGEPRPLSVRPTPLPVAPRVQQEGVLQAVVRGLLDWFVGPGISQTGVPAGYTATTRTTEFSFGPLRLSESVSYTPDSITIALPNGASISATGADAAEVRSAVRGKLQVLLREVDGGGPGDDRR